MMGKWYSWFCFAFMLCCGPLLKGQTSITLNGKVVAPNKDVTGVAVQNIVTKKATITDFEGNFSIQVKAGDTLLFSAVQLKNRILPITATVLKSPFVQVQMEAFVNQLEEVTVRPFNLSGDITKDVAGLQLEKDVSAEALGLPNADVRIISQNERKLFEATTGGGLLPLNPILNAITGRTKMLKKRLNLEQRYNKTQSVQQSIVDSLFLNELKIPKDKVDDFMYFCEVDDDFQRIVAQQDQLKIWAYLLGRSKLYRSQNGLAE